MGTYFKASTAFIFVSLLYFYMAESNTLTREQLLAIV